MFLRREVIRLWDYGDEGRAMRRGRLKLGRVQAVILIQCLSPAML